MLTFGFFKRGGLIVLLRGPLAKHIEYGPLRRGNITLVTDVPELRYHDGKTNGGVAIPLNTEIWMDLKLAYAEALLSSRNTEQILVEDKLHPTFYRRLASTLRTLFRKDKI